MIEEKDKVTHPVHGVGTVVRIFTKDLVAVVDFKGILVACKFSVLQKGANTYIEKSTSNGVIADIKKLLEKYIKERDELCNLESLPTPKLYRFIYLKEIINDLESIIHGKK